MVKDVAQAGPLPGGKPDAVTASEPSAKPGTMGRFTINLLRPYFGWLVIVLVAMLIETAASLAAPWPLKIVIDQVLGSHPVPEWLRWVPERFHGNEKIALAGAAGIFTIVIALVNAIATYIDNYYTESVGQWVAYDLRARVYEHLQRLSLKYYDTHESGSLLSTLTADVSTIQSFASSSTLEILVDLLTILGMLGVMFYLEWDFALIAVAATPFMLLFIARFKRAVKQAQHEVRKRQSDIVAVVQQGLESARVVRAYSRQDLEEARLEQAGRASVEAALKARRVKSLLSPAVNIVVAVATAIVLWRGSVVALAGTMTVGSLVIFLQYLNKFFKPVQDLAKMTNTIAQTTVSLERIAAVLEADTIIPEREGARDINKVRGEVTFEHVAFHYDPKNPVLKDVHFTIKPGQRVGVVGPTGGGKSTVVSLVPRFYDAVGGRVLLDGIDVRDLKLSSLRNQIGFVLQDTALFHGTIKENIAYGRADASTADVIEAAKLANADEFIQRMADGYDTVVGERGSTLSGGQRQRIGIARAIIRNAPILILDEPTAALDTESEQLVIEALDRLMKGRTTITIAHRLSTIRDSDLIVVVKGGVIAEQGSHEELMAKNGIYAELYHIQFGQQAPAVAP